MKSLEEIEEMLISELVSNMNNINLSANLDYYNEILGDTSFLLAGYLDKHLKNNYNDWNNERWIDDSLITKLNISENVLSMWGIIIWGVYKQTEQWTEPFYFEIKINNNSTDFTKTTLLFGDIDYPEITYQEFNQNRYYWDRNYYSSDCWYPFERNWKYIINSGYKKANS